MSTDKSTGHHSHKHIAGAAGVIGLGTLSSRILGFIRDVVIARLFGVEIYAQAFVIAFKIPNLFRDFLAEGATNAAFVPVFTEYQARHTKEEFWELVNCMLNILLVILSLVTLAGIILSPVIVRLIAPGFVASPEKLDATVRLTRIIFPYILLISLAAYAMSVLNSLKHFVVPAFAPCLLNISVIVCAIVLGEGTKGLAAGVLVGGLLQLAVQVPVLYKKGFRVAFPLRLRHPQAKAIGKLIAPRIISSSIYQLNNFVDSIFGSLAWIVGEGGVAVLYFSYRLIQFPLGIFSSSLAQAILPALSEQALNDDRSKLKDTLVFGLRAVFFVMLPASVAFMVLPGPIVSILFGGGKFGLYAADATARALFFYSFGLFAYGATRILQSCFFALKDTVTPTKVSFIALIVNVVLNAVFIFPMGISGLALATSISGVNTFLILFFILKKKLGGFDAATVFMSFLRTLAASAGMGVVIYFLSSRMLVYGATAWMKAFGLGGLMVSGAAAYIIFCFLFRVSEMGALWKLIKGKLAWTAAP